MLLFSADCLLPLGMEDGRIKDENIRARSFLPLASPTNARLNHSEEYGGWCPDQMQYKNKTAPINREFIQIEFGTLLRVKGIVTQGRANGAERVEQYWFSYLGSEGTYEWYFEGNSHRLEVCANKIPDTFDTILYGLNMSNTMGGY